MSIFSIGVSGLNTAQAALNTTSNNISNVYSPGYNRQVTQLSETLVGAGVGVVGIERQFNRFVADQLNRNSSVVGGLQAYQAQVSQIDNLLTDGTSSLSTLMTGFFASLQDVSSTPSDPAARQGMLGSAGIVSSQFRSFASYFDDMQSSVNAQVGDEVTQINNTAGQLAKLNREITLAKAKTGEAPNGLLDQRDKLVSDLSKRLDIRLTVQDAGTYNISLSNGFSLVSGTESFDLVAMRSSSDPSRIGVGYKDSAGNRMEMSESAISGGSLGGLLSFRSEVLDHAQNQLGLMATSLALSFNQQHAAGVDLNGNPGGDFFSVGQPRALSNTNNTGSGTLSASISDYKQLTGSDYDVSLDSSGQYSVVRRDTGAAVAANYDSTANTLTFGGMTVQISGAPAAGDRFQIQPTRGVAQTLEVAISDQSHIAAGTTGKSGDNSNVLELQKLQTSKVVGGQASLSQAYAALVSNIGNSANITDANLSAQQGLNEQLSALQQADSGVNLDEEAANLIRFQQYYQANAKIIQVGSTVFDTLLGIQA
jgi:flagellar hook-associated protein 1 FlgK